MLQPATKFLCCLPLVQGVKFVLFGHLVQSAFTCAMAIGNVILDLPTFGYATSSTQQIYSAAWSLAGIPIILMGLWGVFHRMEMQIHVYLWYLIISFVLDTIYLINLFLIRDACVHIQLASQINHGRAFACGVARGTSGAAAIVITAFMLYLIYIVWSYLVDLSYGGSSNIISDLLKHADRRVGKSDIYDHEEGANSGYNALERSMQAPGQRAAGRIAYGQQPQYGGAYQQPQYGSPFSA